MLQPSSHAIAAIFSARAAYFRHLPPPPPPRLLLCATLLCCHMLPADIFADLFAIFDVIYITMPALPLFFAYRTAARRRSQQPRRC